VKAIRILKHFLPALVIVGLLMGCGGDKGTDAPKGDDKEGGKGGGDKAASLATFLPGKRISFTALDPEAPPQFQKQTMLFQFETDGNLIVGVVMDGKARALPEEKKPSYKVEGLKVIAKGTVEEGEGSITFSSANPKVGDKIIVQGPGEPKGEEVTIAAIEKAGKLEPMQDSGFSQPKQGGPRAGGPDLKIIGSSGAHNTNPNGGSAAGFGPRGEVAKSKHPAFLAHTWRIDPTTNAPKHGAIFAKDGSLNLITADGQMVKGGKWEVADKILTLTYPKTNFEAGKAQPQKYQFLFGRGEFEYSDGGVEPVESLQLSPVGAGPKINYVRSAP